MNSTPTQQAAALVRAYREGRYMAHDLRTEKAETLAALLDIIEVQRGALLYAPRAAYVELRQDCGAETAQRAMFAVEHSVSAALALTDPEEEGRG